MSLENIPIKSLKEVTNYLSRGITPSYTEDEGVIVINQRCIRDNKIYWENIRFTDPDKKKISSDKYIKQYDVLVNSTGMGTLGRSAQVKELFSSTTVDSHVTILRPNELVDPLFFGYAVNMIEKNIENLAEGSTGQTELSRTRLGEEIFINLPSKDNQKKIAYILSNIDKKIESNEKINKNLRNLIKLLYKHYFESFELDNIPENWEIINIESIIDIYNGYSYKGNELQESNCAMVTIKNFNRDGSFRMDGFKEIIYSNKIKKHHFINENDVLISCTDVTQDADIIGNCIIVLDKQNYNELIMSMDLVKIKSKIPEINNFLLASILKSYNFKKHILGYVNGTTVLHLDKKGIKKFKIALPKDVSELKNISKRFELIYAEIQCNQKEINKLTNLRDTLLPKLMSGEIDVSQIDM